MELLAILALAVAAAFVIRTAVLSLFPEIDLQDASDERRHDSKLQRQKSLEELADRIGARVPASKEDETTRQRLERAGLKMQPDTYKGLTTVSTLVCTAAGIVAALAVAPGAGMLAAVIVLVLLTTFGMALPSFAVSKAEKKRVKRIEADLPSTLELLSITVRAGFPMERAVKLVGKRGIGPLAEEFRIVDREVNMLSVPLERALERMSERCADCPGVRDFVLAINQSHKQGTSVTRVLDSQAQISRNKYYTDLLVRVNKIPSKMVPIIFVFFLPIMIVIPLAPSVASVIPTFIDFFPEAASLFGM